MKAIRNSKGQFTSNSNGKENGKTQLTEKAVRQQMMEVVQNASLTRASLFQKLFDPRRSINDECGFPETENITIEEYKSLYDREAVATRVVEVLPKESWMVTPTIFEDEDVDTETPFEADWKDITSNIREGSKLESEEGNPIWEYLERADVASGIGSFGILLMGFNDGKELLEPAEPKKGMKIIFLRVFDESLVKITRFEDDVTNPRFGQPVNYSVTFNDPNNQQQGSTGQQSFTKEVHWTRVIHVADDLGNSEIFAVPRLRPVYNHILNLRKLYHGSAEMFWKGAFPGLSIETHPQLGGDVIVNEEEMRDMVEKYMNTLQRYLNPKGMSVKSLAPQVVDPTPQIDGQTEAICIQKAVPKRIFTGSERGELASSQDKREWHARLGKRQNRYITPRIIAPFIDRCIMLGVLSEPEQYKAVWPDLDTLTEDEQATVATKRTEAMAKYVGGSVENLMHPMDFFTRILGFTQEEAETIIDAVMESEDRLTTRTMEELAEEERSRIEGFQDDNDSGNDSNNDGED